MLRDLDILNGKLDLEFNEYIYEYTVTVSDNINNLEIDYKLDSGCNLSVRDNTLNDFENIVYIDVYNKDELITYTLYVYKENDNYVSGIEDYMHSLEVKSNDTVSLYEMQILAVSMFLSIIIIFSIIFKRKKQKF